MIQVTDKTDELIDTDKVESPVEQLLGRYCTFVCGLVGENAWKRGESRACRHACWQ